MMFEYVKIDKDVTPYRLISMLRRRASLIFDAELQDMVVRLEARPASTLRGVRHKRSASRSVLWVLKSALKRAGGSLARSLCHLPRKTEHTQSDAHAEKRKKGHEHIFPRGARIEQHVGYTSVQRCQRNPHRHTHTHTHRTSENRAEDTRSIFEKKNNESSDVPAVMETKKA